LNEWFKFVIKKLKNFFFFFNLLKIGRISILEWWWRIYRELFIGIRWLDSNW
jgi:hypothetical protein